MTRKIDYGVLLFLEVLFVVSEKMWTRNCLKETMCRAG